MCYLVGTEAVLYLQVIVQSTRRLPVPSTTTLLLTANIWPVVCRFIDSYRPNQKNTSRHSLPTPLASVPSMQATRLKTRVYHTKINAPSPPLLSKKVSRTPPTERISRAHQKRFLLALKRVPVLQRGSQPAIVAQQLQHFAQLQVARVLEVHKPPVGRLDLGRLLGR